jgi:magnesium transporter
MPQYKQISSNIQKVAITQTGKPNKKLVWLNIANAGKNEIEYLRKNHKFSLSHLQSASAKVSAQRPTFEYNEEGRYLFIILHFPFLKNGNIAAGEIDFFMKKGLLATIHNNNLPALNDFFNLCKKDGDSLISAKYGSAAVLLYELLKKLMHGCYNLLDENSLKIIEIEDLVFSGKQRETISGIYDLRRNIINFRKIIQNHKNILKKKMEKQTSSAPNEIIRKFYGELIDDIKTIWEILDNQKEMVEVLKDTDESLVSNRLSEIIKTLTIFSVIVFPLTLLAAIFGMNTTKSMPFIETENGFWWIIAIMLSASLGMLLFFKKKKWL